MAKTRQQLIRELREAKQRNRQLQMIFDSAPAHIWFKDDQERFINVNKTMCRALGVPRKEFIGKTNAGISRYKDTFEEYHKIDRDILTTGLPNMGREEPVESAQGWLWCLVNRIPIRDASGRITGLVAIAVDITKRKKAEEELKKSRDRLHVLSSHLQSVREQERRAISRELHGELGQALDGLKRELARLKKIIPREDEALLGKISSLSGWADKLGQTALKVAGELGDNPDELGRESAPEELIDAIQKIAYGYQYISSVLAEKMTAGMESSPSRPLHHGLSAREYQIMKMIASGKKLKQIAAELELSVKTVSTYKYRIFEKMQVNSDTHIVRYVLENRL